MFKVLTIGGKDYKFEYSIEASLYKDCAEKVTGVIFGTAMSANDVQKMISQMADIPSIALTLFYAGLLEYHGAEGDGSVNNISDAKKLLRQYFAEHKEDGTGNFYGILNMCIDQMIEDNFFEQIGLGNMTEEVEAPKAKTPTDHKKKNVAIAK